MSMMDLMGNVKIIPKLAMAERWPLWMAMKIP